jgi:hypothetical protein
MFAGQVTVEEVKGDKDIEVGAGRSRSRPVTTGTTATWTLPSAWAKSRHGPSTGFRLKATVADDSPRTINEAAYSAYNLVS